MRIDDPAVYNPFGWRIAELAELAADDPRRRELLAELVVCEAEELARGRRHLTIVHGDPDNVADSRHLTAFYEALGALASAAEWARVRGSVDYVTVTVAGPDAERLMSVVATAAERADPGWWRITHDPYPDLT